MNQVCKECSVEKPITDFEHQKARPSPRKTCKLCRYLKRNKETELIRHRKYSKERRFKFPDLVRQSYEKSVYGKIKEDFDYNHCMICFKTEDLCIDHNHATTKVRGLLCGHCNRGLGLFRDNITFLQNAIKYLGDNE